MENSNNSAHDPVSSSVESPDKSSDSDHISFSSDGTESSSDVSPRIMKWNPVTLSLRQLGLSDHEKKKVKSEDSSDLVGYFEGKLVAEVDCGEENAFLEEMINLLEGDQKTNIHDFLLQGGLDVSLSEEAIKFFRSIASYEIQERSEFFEPFVKGSTGETVAEFCINSVEQMANETDHVEITALSEALEVHMRVVYLDQSVDTEGLIKVNHHDFKPEGSDDEPVVNLLYRPGHYDILYR